MRKIGDQVWVSRFFATSGVYVTCPDCGGTGRIRVILHDETMHSIECGNCSRGYEPPTGEVLVYTNNIEAKNVTIVEVKQSLEGIEYITNDRHVHCEHDLFDCESDALLHGQKEQDKWIEEQKRRIFEKEKDTKTWAWNVSYHKKCIKDAQKNLDYHTKKLNAANLKNKAS